MQVFRLQYKRMSQFLQFYTFVEPPKSRLVPLSRDHLHGFPERYTRPRIFHHTAATKTRSPMRTGVATAPALVRSEALKYR